jgi:hypothetical protein
MHKSYFVLSKGKEVFDLYLKFVQSKKNPWSAGLNFIDLGGIRVFLLYKIICKDNNTHVQSFNDQ